MRLLKRSRLGLNNVLGYWGKCVLANFMPDALLLTFHYMLSI